MKKLGLLTKETITGELKGEIQKTSGYFFIGFNKIAAYPFNVLRNELKEAGARVLITKNTLFDRVLAELKGQSDLKEMLNSETGLVLVYDSDVVKVCKVLIDFAKENESLQLKGGVIKDRKVSQKDLKALAKLPSREVLLGMVVSAMASPLTGFLSSLNQIILKFIWVVEEIKKTKDKKNK
ncbi:MAG: 50S ribosomal protein L10 [Candidatus Omnitrophica bacterium]|jgi:large subunit ribosomal protein L10|nr:50S ribosomal protein L10 [Candidatus Omnitrophota bacterium]